MVIGIPSQITEVEKRAVEDAARNAGAREVYLVEEPVAAAIGCRMPIHKAVGNMIIDIGEKHGGYRRNIAWRHSGFKKFKSGGR